VLLAVLVGWNVRAEQSERERAAQIIARYTQLEDDMRAHLPVGTSYPQITAYLQGKGITYSYSTEDKEIRILFADVVRNWIFSTRIQVIINLDDRQRLQSIVFRTVGAGP
jgi:hypothetical protein